MIGRRRFFYGLGVSLVGLPAAGHSLAAASSARVGFLLVGLTPESDAAQHFRKGLRDAGYSEGRDIVIEWQSTKGDYERVRGVVAEFIRSKVDVIVVDSTVGAQVAK